MVLQVRSRGSVGVDGFVGRAVGAFVGRSVFGVVVLYQWCCGDVVIKVVEFVDSPRSKNTQYKSKHLGYRGSSKRPVIEQLNYVKRIK